MKRILSFALSVCLLVFCLAGCAQSTAVGDLSHTSYIEVRAFSMTDQTYNDYVISDYKTVDEICATFTSLTLKKVKITEPLAMTYQLRFFDHAHREFDSLMLIAGKNTLDYGGDLYNVLDDCDLQAYMDGIVLGLTPENT